MKNNKNNPRLPKAALAAAALLAAFTGTANANPVYWDGGGADNLVITAENWTTDTLPTGGILGIINNDFVNNPTVSAGASAGGNVTGYTVEQYSGLLSPNGNITLAGGTVWTLKGGNITTPSNIFTLNASSLIIDGGTFSSASRRFIASNTSLLEVKSGSFSNGAEGLRTANASASFTINVSGGSLTSTRLGLDDNGSTLSSFTITGGTADFTSTTDASTLGAGMTFGVGNTGSVTFGIAPTVSSTSSINFLTTSMVSLTVSGYGQSDYEAWWNAGSLKRDGGNVGSFADSFTVDGAKLTVIPEPGTLVMVGVMGLALLAGLRRRK